MIRTLAALLASTALAFPALALQTPTPNRPDEPRTVSVPYAPDDVAEVIVPAQGATMITMSAAETKFDVAISVKGWRHDAAGNAVVFSADPGAPTTVAHVVSYLPDGTTRRYAWLLIASAQGVKPTMLPTDPVRVASNDLQALPVLPTPYLNVRVTYAAEEAKAKVATDTARRVAAQQAWRAQRSATVEAAPSRQARATLALDAAAQRRRCNFMWRGDAAVLPLEACGTGSQTTFLWAGQMPVAAVFLVAADGTEQAVSQAPAPDRPGLLTVPTTSRFWRIRRGTLVADLYDASFTEVGQNTGTDTLSPRVRTRLRASAGATP